MGIASATWIGGWPCGAVSELVGAPGSGRFALVLPVLRQLAQQGANLVIVDSGQCFHPPSAPDVCASLLLLRPPPAQAAWTAEQVARAGAVPLVVLLDPPPLGRAGARLVKAAEAGNCVVITLATKSDADLPAALRLSIEGWTRGALSVRCTRARDGRAVGHRLVRFEAQILPVRWPT